MALRNLRRGCILERDQNVLFVIHLAKLECPFPYRKSPEVCIAELGIYASAINGYSAVVLSSAAEIQRLRPYIRRSLLQDDPLLDPEFFLASVTENWTPRVVAVSHGEELRGVVYTKERNFPAFRLKVAYADLTFGTALFGDLAEQETTFLVGLEALLGSAGSRGIRLRVRRGGPELAAVRKLLSASRLDARFSRVKNHSRLLLPNTYEEFLLNFGSTTRRNFRYYRRRFESAGHIYVGNLSMDELRGASFHLDPKCRVPSRHHSIERFLRMTATAERPLAAGLKHRNGEWLGIICGVCRPESGMILMQLNNDREFPRESLSVVLRGYLIESLIHQGFKELDFWASTTRPLSRYSKQISTLGIYLDSPEYLWRLIRGLVSIFGSRMPGQIEQQVRWIAPFS